MRKLSILIVICFACCCSVGGTFKAFGAGGQQEATKITIDEVKFDGPVHLSAKLLGDFVIREKQMESDAESDWTSEIEQQVRDLWQRNGYFRVNEHVTPHLESTDAKFQHYSLDIHVDEGLQYRLGDIRFVPADHSSSGNGFAFPAAQLRKQFNLREGDLFDIDDIRHGIETLTKLYGSDGYIDFTAVPQFAVNDADKLITLTVRLAEQAQYRVGKVEVEGLDSTMERILRSTIKEGKVFNTRLLNDFYDKYKLDLPEGTRPETMATIDRNIRNCTVGLRFDFRTRPDLGK